MDGIVGMIKMVVGDLLPSNWAFCDGKVHKVADYPALAASLRNQWGGDGTETFALPKLADPPAGKYVICLENQPADPAEFKGLISQITLFVGQDLPKGWAYCDGRVLAADQYPVLAQVMGQNYGGDGKTTVGLPTMEVGGGMHYIICLEGVDPRGAQGGGDDDDDY